MVRSILLSARGKRSVYLGHATEVKVQADNKIVIALTIAFNQGSIWGSLVRSTFQRERVGLTRFLVRMV